MIRRALATANVRAGDNVTCRTHTWREDAVSLKGQNRNGITGTKCLERAAELRPCYFCFSMRLARSMAASITNSETRLLAIAAAEAISTASACGILMTRRDVPLSVTGPSSPMAPSIAAVQSDFNSRVLTSRYRPRRLTPEVEAE